MLTWQHHAVTADLSAAHPWCKSPVPPHPKGALLDWDLVTVEAIWVKWTHCHVQETSLRWFELCDMVHYPAGSSHQKMVHCSHKRMDMVSNNTQLWCFNNAKLVQSVPRKYPPHHYNTNTSLNHWDKAGWIHVFMFFTPNSDPTIWMSQQKSRLIRPANVSHLLLSILVSQCEM